MVVKKKAVPKQVITDQYCLYNADCVEAMKQMPADSVGFCKHSPPFAQLYAYSDSDKDMGNCRTYEEFFIHYGFAVEQLNRIMMPGRIVAAHCIDLPTFKSKEGYIGLNDFPGDIIRLFLKHGFVYHCPRITIWKDPLIAATRSHSIGLAHKQIVKDSSMCNTGIPDFILGFRKLGDNPVPIAHPTGLIEYPGEKQIPRDLDRYIGWEDQRTNKRSHWIWQQIASPVWTDIRQTKVLPYKKAKEEDDQKHLCPLQTDTIDRCLILWSNPDEIVLDPFSGVGSVVHEAVRMGRKGVGIELKHSYHRQAVRNLRDLKKKTAIVDSGFGG